MIELAQTGNHDGGRYYLSDDRSRFIYVWDDCDQPFEIEVSIVESALRQPDPEMAVWMLGAGYQRHIEWYRYLTKRTADRPLPTAHPADADWYRELITQQDKK